jgi:hypothetical protein
MVATIILNSTNIVQNGNNNSLIYKFPNSVQFSNHTIAIQSISMYYSWTNINANPLENNTFTYSWVVGGVTTIFTIVIPDGLYEITDLNKLLQFEFIQNGHYLIDTTGKFVYYADMVVNPNRYAIQVNTFAVPTALPAGWTQPASWVGYPTTTFNPSLTFPANFSRLIGYADGFSTFINTGVGTTLSYLSTKAPAVQPNSSIYLAISNIHNQYASPSSIIYNITPRVGLGEQINEYPPQFAWNKLMSGTYNELRIQFLGLDKQPITLLDPEMSIVLVINENDGTDNVLTKR